MRYWHTGTTEFWHEITWRQVVWKWQGRRLLAHAYIYKQGAPRGDCRPR